MLVQWMAALCVVRISFFSQQKYAALMQDGNLKVLKMRENELWFSVSVHMLYNVFDYYTDYNWIIIIKVNILYCLVFSKCFPI